MRVAGTDAAQANVGVYSYGEKGNVFPKAQYEFQVKLLRDPSGQKQFESLAGGNDPEVIKWVRSDPRIPAIIDSCLLLAQDLLLPKGTTESPISASSKWVSFSFVDVHGRWISPAIAEIVAEALSEEGFRVSTQHYGLKK